MASDAIVAAAEAAGCVVATDVLGPSFPSRDRIVRAVRELDDQLAGSPEDGLPRVPLTATLSARWADEIGETTQDLGRVHHLRTLLELALAHLSLGNAEAPNGR